MKPTIPRLPDVARSLLKSSIVALANSGLITAHDAQMLLGILDLHDA